MNYPGTVTQNTRKFEFIARHLWPTLRIFSKKQLTPRCKLCTISSKVEGIALKDGVCNKCREFNANKQTAIGAGPQEDMIKKQCRELEELLRSYQGRGKGRYDAMVAFSGGKDSTYLLYKLKTEYPGLRLLTATWNNGFYSPVALDNARDVAKKLDVEHLLYKPRSDVFKKMYRYTLTHVKEGGCYISVDNLDGSLNQHIGLNLAAQLEIPLFLTGVDWAQAVIMGGHTHFEVSRQEMETTWDRDRIERMSKVNLRDIFSEDDMKLWWDGSKWPKERIPRGLIPFIAWRPSAQEIIQTLAKAGLLMPAYTSPLITNNEILPLMAAVDIVRFGYFSFEPEFSDMVRHKQADPILWRNVFELLEYLVKTKKFMNKAYLEVLQRLDLTPKELGL